jgi:nitrate reductase assembly molybdenum cofactor insertion protein NarJ
MGSLEHYEHLAALFEYPGVDYPDRVRAARASLAGRYPAAASHLDALAGALPSGPGPLEPDVVAELQEVFTRSFDVQAITTLSVGYLVFGDDYKRGELLTHLRREQTAAGVAAGVELPDHLPAVLRLLARWSDRDLAAELVQEIVRPAVQRMIAEFGPERMQERDRLYEKHFRTLIASPTRATLFRDPLAALASVLDQDFERSERAGVVADSDFLRSIGRELDIEATEGRPAPRGRML